MNVLGPVLVASAKLVKAVSMIGVVATGIAVMAVGVGILLTSGTIHPGMAVAPLLGYFASSAGWHMADWVEGKLVVNQMKSAQENELARLQSAHGVAL